MPKEDEIDLFGDGDDITIEIPTTGEAITFNDDMPEASDFDGVISGDTIKTVMIEEKHGIDIPSYLIDISGIGEMTGLAFSSLRALIADSGDTAVYLKTDTVLLRLGVNSEQKLYRIIGLAISKVFEGQATVYKNTGDGFKILIDGDVASIRLKL